MTDERKYGSIPGSRRGLSCSEFDALLADAIDGTLAAEQLQAFDLHARTCDGCGPLLEGARQGMDALRSLDEIEPPSSLIHNILARTSHAEATAPAKKATPTRQHWLFAKLFSGALRPRMITTAAMAFFSLSLMFSVTGLRISDFRNIDLRPSVIHKAVAHDYYATSARFNRYYKNTRLVYELESRLHELRNATQGNSDDQPGKKTKPTSKTSREERQQTGSTEDMAVTEQHLPEITASALRSDLTSNNVSIRRRLA